MGSLSEWRTWSDMSEELCYRREFDIKYIHYSSHAHTIFLEHDDVIKWKYCIMFMKCIDLFQNNKVGYYDQGLARKWTFIPVITFRLETLLCWSGPPLAELHVILVYPGILSWTWGNIIVCRSLHVTVYVLTISVWCQRNAVSMKGSHTCATTAKQHVPHREAILGYVQSVAKLVTNICEEHTFCPCRPYV